MMGEGERKGGRGVSRCFWAALRKMKEVGIRSGGRRRQRQRLAWGLRNEAFKEGEAEEGVHREQRTKKCTWRLCSQSGVCGRHGQPDCPEMGVEN